MKRSCFDTNEHAHTKWCGPNAFQPVLCHLREHQVPDQFENKNSNQQVKAIEGFCSYHFTLVQLISYCVKYYQEYFRQRFLHSSPIPHLFIVQHLLRASNCARVTPSNTWSQLPLVSLLTSRNWAKI